MSRCSNSSRSKCPCRLCFLPTLTPFTFCTSTASLPHVRARDPSSISAHMPVVTPLDYHHHHQHRPDHHQPICRAVCRIRYRYFPSHSYDHHRPLTVTLSLLLSLSFPSVLIDSIYDTLQTVGFLHLPYLHIGSTHRYVHTFIHPSIQVSDPTPVRRRRRRRARTYMYTDSERSTSTSPSSLTFLCPFSMPSSTY